MSKVEFSTGNTPTWVILLICIVLAGCLAYGAKHDMIIPVGPQPTPEATK